MGLSEIDLITLSTLAFAEKVYNFADSIVIEKPRRILRSYACQVRLQSKALRQDGRSLHGNGLW